MKLLSFFIIFLIGCSNIKMKKPTIVGPVDVFKKDSPAVTSIDNSDQNSTDFYGPKPEGDILVSTKKRDPVIGVVLLPALNLSYRYIGFLKLLEDKDIKVNILMSSGIPSLLSSVYAQSKSISKLEWVVYKRYGNKKVKEKLFSNSWKSKWKKALESDLKGKNIEQSKIPLVIPYLNRKEERTLLAKRGDNLNIAMKQLEFSGDRISGVLADLNYNDILKSYGADIVIIVDALGDKISLKGRDDFLYGTYNTFISKKVSQFDESSIYINLSKDSDYVDQLNNPDIQIKEGYLSSQSFVKEIILRLKDWKESDT